MPLTGQELHFADQIDALIDRVGRIERYLGGRWKIADVPDPHQHTFRGPIGPSRLAPGGIAEKVCECGAELVLPPPGKNDG